MTQYGYFLAAEEYSPRDLVDQAILAEEAGFESLWISDHFHPWNDTQGQSGFVWSLIGAIATQTSLPIATAVTCPTIRIHPAIIAQAAATSAVLCGGDRFGLGVGTGENLNEHVLGDRWPPAEVRIAMLEEAVEIIRKLWTGDLVTHHGPHYTVENARIYSLPDAPPPILVSAFGPKATEMAAHIGDGYMGTSPQADLVQRYRQLGGTGPLHAGMKMCWGSDRDECLSRALELWGTSSIPGEASQELPMPSHFEQAAGLVTEGHIADKYSCGPDVDEHVASVRKYEQAGYDVIHVAQIGGAGKDFFAFARDELLPTLCGVDGGGVAAPVEG